jgi:hypothetical protein
MADAELMVFQLDNMLLLLEEMKNLVVEVRDYFDQEVKGGYIG